MLRIEVSPWEKRMDLMLIVFGLIFFSVVPFLILLELLDGGYGGGSVASRWLVPASNCMTCILFLIVAVRSLMENWFAGRVNIGLVANNKTLAIVRKGGRTTFIKRGKCVGIYARGYAIVSSDGSRYDFTPAAFCRNRFDREFLLPLYTWWWRDFTVGSARYRLELDSRAAAASVKRRIWRTFLIAAVAPIVGFAAVMLVGSVAPMWPAVGAATYFAAVFLYLLVYGDLKHRQATEKAQCEIPS